MGKSLSQLTKELRELSNDLTSDPLYSAINGNEDFDEAELAECLAEAREEQDDQD
jgi:hypothetical protein